MKTKCAKCGGAIKADKPAAVLYDPIKREVLTLCSKECKQAISDGSAKPRTQKTGQSETEISRAIGKELDDAGVWNTRLQSGRVMVQGGGTMHLCRTGTPDRVFAFGLPVWIEVKKPGQIPTPEQLKTHAALRSNGSLVFVVDDAADVELITQRLADMSNLTDTILTGIAAVQTILDLDLSRNRSRRGVR